MSSEEPKFERARENIAGEKVDRDVGLALLKSPHALSKILDLADDAIISVDEQFRIILFNQGAEKIFGYSSQSMLGRSMDVLLPGRLVAAHRDHMKGFSESRVTARRMGERSVIFGRHASGVDFPAEASISKVDVDGRRMYTVILRDVTERVTADEKLKTSLKEKEALLKEIHHRVKNNLQVVSSLLGLQSRLAGDLQTRKMFKESQDRIHSMALLHESLYQSNELSRVDFPEYIRQLTAHLFHSYGVAQERIRLRSAMKAITLPLDAAVPCGLIVNELISNSLKYAFPDGRKGEVSVELVRDTEGMARLLVSDDGIGLPGEIDVATARSLGLRLVRTLAEQLGGALEIKTDKGTKVALSFATSA